MIAYYSVLFVSFFLIGLFLRIWRRVFHKLAENSFAVLDGLLIENQNDTKIQEVQKKTNQLVYALFKMLFAILVAFAIGSIPLVIFCLVKEMSFYDLEFTSFYSVLIISIGATIPFIIPLDKKNKSSYSELSQLLHRMALNNYYLSNLLFKKETKKIEKRGLNKRNDFVIISGLARAGTTSLMNDLSKIQDFHSLNYSNMPFLMCPNIWKKFYKPKSSKLKERSHKDGIMIGYDSNEALEEYFFKVKANDSFVDDNYLSEYEVSEEVYNDYIDYQTIIKRDNKKIYLAKNNNFILRYKSIRALNADFLMVILFREPLTHAASLLEKHNDYKKLQSEDQFVLEYMNWLGHHEFGQNQKHFKFNKEAYDNQYDKSSLNYWLKNWIYYYNHILNINHENTMLVNYDSYCKHPRDVVSSILKKIGISAEIPDLTTFNNARKTNLGFDTSLHEEAQRIYLQLIEQSNDVV